jgi:hypothetical protein
MLFSFRFFLIKMDDQITTISVIMSIIALISSVVLTFVTRENQLDTHVMFEQSQKVTRIERLERKLEKFYTPLQRVFVVNSIFLDGTEKSLSLRWTENREAFYQLARYCYLAEPEVRSLYLECVIDKNYNPRDIQLKLEHLMDRVNKDIDDYNAELNELTEYKK